MSIKKRKGFGLIEVMTALVVMIIVIGATGTVTQQSISTALGAEDSIVAAGLAQSLIEEVRFSRDQNPSGPIEVTFEPRIILNNIEYTRSVTIDEVSDNQLLEGVYWQVGATVQWNDTRTNQTREYTLETILTKWPI